MAALVQRCSGTALAQRCTSGASLVKRCFTCPPYDGPLPNAITLTASGINYGSSCCKPFNTSSCASVVYDFRVYSGPNINSTFTLTRHPSDRCWYYYTLTTQLVLWTYNSTNGTCNVHVDTETVPMWWSVWFHSSGPVVYCGNGLPDYRQYQAFYAGLSLTNPFGSAISNSLTTCGRQCIDGDEVSNVATQGSVTLVQA